VYDNSVDISHVSRRGLHGRQRLPAGGLCPGGWWVAARRVSAALRRGHSITSAKVLHRVHGCKSELPRRMVSVTSFLTFSAGGLYIRT
jgi:hypothetical protein